MPSERKSEKPNHLADEIEITNNILDGLRAIDKDILAGVPMKAALDGVCRSMVEIFGLKLCWVGLLQEGTFEVRPTAFWGSEEGYLSAIRVTYDDSEYGRGPSGTAIKTRRPAIRNDIEGEAVSTLWREETLKRGYRSSAAFSLIYEGKVVGVLNVYAAEPCYFDRRQVKLLQAFADQTAILISAALRLEALRKSEAMYRGLVEAATDAVVSADGDGKIVLWNPAAARLFGYSEREALGKDLTIIIPERYRGQALKAFEEATRTGRLRRGAGHVVEAEGLRKDGTTFPLEHSISIEETPMGTCFTTIIRDITERKKAENELRLLATVVQDSNDAIIVRDLSNKILTWNPAAERLYGYKQGEMVGRDFSTIIPGEQVERATSFLKRVIAGEKLFQIDIRRLCKNGQILDVSVTASPLRDRQGNVMAVATTEMDITERKKMEAELLESEKLYHTLFDNAPVGLGIADADGNLIAYNDAMLTPGGYTREDIAKIGNVTHLYYDLKERAETLAIAQKQGFLHQHEVRFKRKDSTPYDALLSLTSVKIKGRPCWQAVVEDITERKRTEKALQESERKFKDLAEKSPIGTYLIQDGVFVYVNPILAEIFGYTVDELIEKKGPRELVLPEDWPIVEENIRKRVS
ncbi:MAG: PAS domain S-box protein, partial [Candidatus Hydrothermarchaeota archaeon]